MLRVTSKRGGGWLISVAACALLAATVSAASANGGDTKTAIAPARFDWHTLGFRAAKTEQLARGPSAVAVGIDGTVYVLDAVNERVVKMTGEGTFVPVATVPRDADDLAVADDGAFAVLRTTKPQVLVFAKDGSLVGDVDTSAVERISSIALERSRRVRVVNDFQESFLLGSPSMKQLPNAIRANKREGVVRLPNGDGVVAVKADGEVSLHVVRTENDRSSVVMRVSLGKADAARVVGATGVVACARVEHLLPAAADGALRVSREAVCVDTTTGEEKLRVALPEPGAYVPRRELAFAEGKLVHLTPTESGLAVSTWRVAGGAR